MVSIDWERFLTIDADWWVERLSDYEPYEDGKLKARIYSVRFTGTQQRIEQLAEDILFSIPHFCFSPDRLRKLEDQNIPTLWKAANFFGDIDPDSDGKLGEMLLFLLVESINRAPIMAYKITSLTNPGDQVKGGDGIFLGTYEGSTAILVGESKLHKNRGSAVKEALDSLGRFHETSGKMGYELDIAANIRRTDLTANELDVIYDKILNTRSEEHRKCVLVHPVLICYDEGRIDEIACDATSCDEAEAEMCDHCRQALPSIAGELRRHLAHYPYVAQAFLDFFYLPIADVSKFRHAFYRALHHAEYRPRPK